jgi:hypothetical protein
MISTRATVTIDALLAKLRAMERGFATRWMMLAFGGGVVCLIGPAIFGTFYWLRQFRGGGVRIAETHTWIGAVSLTAAWFLPVLFFIEWVTRGKLLENTLDTAGDMGFSYGNRMVGGGYFAGRAMTGAMLIEICLWGPRMVIGGAKRLFSRTQHASADRNLAAKMLHAMLLRGEGLPTAQLYPLANGRDDAFSDALAYLLFFDLIGIAKAGDRAWITSEGKRALKLEA